MGPPRQCEVCNGAQSKYKCPSCHVPYCSLACFKKHKEIPCNIPSPSETKLGSSRVSLSQIDDCPAPYLPKVSYKVEEHSFILQSLKFNSIANSSEIRDALKDEHIRKLINQIDHSKDPENELDKALEGHEFREFTNKILDIISPQD